MSSDLETGSPQPDTTPPKGEPADGEPAGETSERLPAIEFEQVLTPADVRRRLGMGIGLPAMLIFIALGAASRLLGVLSGTEPFPVDSLICSVAALVGGIFLLVTPYLSLPRDPAARHRRYRLSEIGIDIEWGRSSTHIAWVDIDHYRFDRHLVGLFRGRQPVIHLPRAGLGDQGEAFLRERLAAVNATPSGARRPWLRIVILWVLLVVAFVVLYSLVAQE